MEGQPGEPAAPEPDEPAEPVCVTLQGQPGQHPQTPCACGSKTARKWRLCSACTHTFCTKKCYKDHKAVCSTERSFEKFWDANLAFFKVIGVWLRLLKDHNYVGMHIAVDDDPEKDVKVTPIDALSASILLTNMNLKLQMPKVYEDYMILVIDKAGVRMAMEGDLVKDGRMVVVRCPLFEKTQLHKFIVPPGPAARGETRNDWQKDAHVSIIKRPWQNFPHYQATMLAKG